MASSKFDELTRALATSTSRRQTLKTICASVLGGALAFGGLGTALAAKGGCKCTTDADCDPPKVAQKSACDTHTCQNYVCSCRSSGTGKCSQDKECCSGSCDTTKRLCK
jgi:hypothetical protein